jgi:release factor glutamine methyltransferase
MTIKGWLELAIKLLEKESGTAQLDAEIILKHVLKVDRSWLHAHPEFELPKDSLNIMNTYLDRRAKHEPMAYILRMTEFYGREFYITNGVLVPRPESETMIDLCKKYCLNKGTGELLLVDVGTGSGALIITAVLETNITDALAIDIDDICLSIAKKNIKKYNLDIDLEKSDLLESLLNKNVKNKNLVILANLPYVPEKYSINSEAKNEPAHAIFGGQDGLDLYRILFNQLADIKASSITIFTESLPFQHTELVNIAKNYGLLLETSEDFIQVFTR